MEPRAYNNHMQLFQTPDYVVILNEMVHDARIIPLGTGPIFPEGVLQWMGDSRGRWEGETLVVDTTNLYDKNSFTNRYDATPAMHLVERFTRVDAATLVYEFTVEDLVFVGMIQQFGQGRPNVRSLSRRLTYQAIIDANGT